MCDAVSWISFGTSAASSIANYGSEKRGVRARNRAKLLNFKYENEAYIADSILQNTAWKDQQLNTQIKIEDLSRQALDQWAALDLQVETLYDKHAWNQIDALTEMYRKEYAGEQTGVTAQRLANEPIRQAGFAITRSMAELIINKDALELQKDAALDEGDRKRREQWRINRQSPIPGPTPIPQPLEAEPGIGGLLAQLAIAGATSYIGGQLNKGNNPFNPGGGNKVATNTSLVPEIPTNAGRFPVNTNPVLNKGEIRKLKKLYPLESNLFQPVIT